MIPESLKTLSRSIFLLSSDEALLLRDWLDAARAALRAQGVDEIISHRVDTGFNWDELQQDGMSLSLFSERRCHIIQFNSNKPGQAGARFFSSLGSPNDDSIYILVMSRLDQASKKSAWFKKLGQVAELCELATVYPNQLAQWISQRAQQKGLIIEQQAAMLLADLTEGNLLASDQELEKLSLSVAKGSQITVQQLGDSLTRSARYTHYLLLDACLAGQVKRVHKILQGLKLEGVLPVQIQYALHSTLETLLTLKQAQQQSQLNPGLWQSLRVWKSKQQLYMKALTRLSGAQLERLLGECATLDRVNKGQQNAQYVDEDWRILTQLVSELSGNQTIGYQTT